MRTIKTAIVRLNELSQTLEPFLEQVYELPRKLTSGQIMEYLQSMRNDLYAYVEYPYVDKVYRNSYYYYFSTKHRRYDRDSIRVSLFERKITDEHFREETHYEYLMENFLGFFTLRPTLVSIVGRSMISPKALKARDFCCCLVRTSALINGRKLSVEAFPYTSQDTETISCAETTVWGIMEYFGNRYAEYKPVLPSTIISALSSFSYERQIPSHGLTAEQISYALKSFDFGVRVYARDIYKEDLRRIFNYYIESGIPFVAVLKNNDIGHGIIVMGRENWTQSTFATGKASEMISSGSRVVEIFDTADNVDRYLAMDDNFPPYQLANFDDPTGYYKDPKFKNCSICAIIVPLYHKIYLEALQARQLVFSIIKSDICRAISGKIVLRLQLTSSRSFKHNVSTNPSIDHKVRDLILATDMAKFIWVAELSTPELFPQKLAFGLILLDATEANENSLDALLLMLFSNNLVILTNNKELKSYPVPFGTFSIYLNNLKGGF